MLGTFLSFVALAALSAGQNSPASSAAAPSRTVAAPVAATGVVNLNTAASSELASLPGIGPKTAERILEYRQKNGPFKKIEDLMNVRGVGEKSFLKLRSRITVGTPRPEHAGAQPD
jgi:competence protein ComEA